MATATTPSTEVHVSGGFRIEISPDRLSVAGVESRAALWVVVTYVVVFFYMLLVEGRSSAFLAVLLVGVVGTLRFFLVGVHNIRGTHECLSVTDVFHGRKERLRAYPRAQIDGIGFGAISFSRYGANGGLVVDVGGKRIKALYGLKCVEAEIIRNDLQRLGYKIYRDPGMPMMIEMEQSRRKSWLGRWLS